MDGLWILIRGRVMAGEATVKDGRLVSGSSSSGSELWSNVSIVELARREEPTMLPDTSLESGAMAGRW